MWYGIVGAVLAGLLVYALIEPYRWKLTEYSVAIDNLPPSFEGFTILHLSDLHGRVGFFSWPPFLRALTGADLVAITGDLYSPSLPRQRLATKLATLEAPSGVFYVSGNHDYRAGRLAVEPYQPGDARLDNRVRRVFKQGESILLAGLPDFIKGRPDWDAVRRQLDQEGGPVVLLAHRPDAVLLDGVERVALILAGHTHGGQVRLPILGAPLRHNHIPGRYVAGRLNQPGGPVLITSQGLGTSELPVRFMARPEVVLVHLKALRPHIGR